MATIQRVSHSSLGESPNDYGLSKGGGNGGGEAAVSDQFPAGLRVLVVDDDTTCLRIIEQMLHRCLYHVTLCSQAAAALNLLRENKGCFDVVLSDVHMPDMDGYKLLEYVGLEMELPVIMMSADKRTSAVMKGIRHGACDYLIKPIRQEELKNIWQHVVRKKWNEYKELENSESLVENDKQMRGTDEAECASSAHEEEGIKRATRKRSSSKEDEGELENDDPSASKKPRVVWSVELHQQFVIAVNQLGLDKAVPKRILELMNVPGLTRENVASHLQKFRLYLKRLSGVAYQQNAIPNIYCGPLEQNFKLDAFGVETLASSVQISPQTLAALHTELLGRSMCNLRPSMDQPAVLQGSLEGTKLIAVEHEPVDSFSQTLVKCQTSNSKNYFPSVMSVDCVTSAYSGACPPNGPSFVVPNNLGRMCSQNANMLVSTLQHQQQHKQYEQQQVQKQHPRQQLMSSEPSCSITVQPSCLVLPSPSSVNFLAGNIPEFSKHDHNNNRGTIIDYSVASPQLISSLSNFNQTDGELNPHNAISGYLTQMSGSSVHSLNDANNSVGHAEASRLISPGSYLPGVSHKKIEIKGFNGSRSEMLDQGAFRNLALVGKGSSSQRRPPVEETAPPMTNEQLDQWKNYMPNRIRKKQEPLVKYVESTKVEIPIQKVLQ